ncbi:VOC family protein [Sphingomonas sp. LaA6.9]|uniref:VOC family protein n=1 Tax=Sphingomonas sp. LaA6.9 TaxID=2919914 RepID=UPI001F4F4351|nr:VOC family protein [Sphingomonas sp. LaA6.9]MCJ8157493.1 VOC family protein [Sphingomonas sp. LaA6.9]
MPSTFIEHVNLTVSDPERTAGLMAELFGWHIRWQGPAIDGGRTIHVGDDRSYLALYTANHASAREAFAKGQPLNHVGIVVDDLDAIEAKVKSAGLISFGHGDYAPGRRFYFLDHDGIEFEIVSYASKNAT